MKEEEEGTEKEKEKQKEKEGGRKRRRNRKMALYEDREKFLRILLAKVLKKVQYLPCLLLFPLDNVPRTQTFYLKLLYFLAFKSFTVYS